MPRKKPIPLPDQETLLELLRYEPETGKLFWRERPEKYSAHAENPLQEHNRWNARHANTEAFTHVYLGYHHGALLGRLVKAHRVIWKMMTGQDPDQIDHINGKRADNRWANLRNVSHAENGRNQRLARNNTTGVNGVSFHRKRKRFVASIRAGGTTKWVGEFKTLEEAADARAAANQKYGYHANHGAPK